MGLLCGRGGYKRATRSPALPNAISSAWKQHMPGSAECALIGVVLTYARVHQLACSAYVKKVPKGPASFTRGVARVPLLFTWEVPRVPKATYHETYDESHAVHKQYTTLTCCYTSSTNMKVTQ